ncbi:lipase family protein [Chitinophaga agrisoli]|uniref:Lipase family protein n=1 Tax=Chitinophaga agrisoli TaxID=2607653 RepID=A0A5B2VKD7_9BACT|nr:lipase family protein [Chitinophaga agrisoli]KAA2238996.1 lipase family protein [Chitinophaga agrisoli]
MTTNTGVLTGTDAFTSQQTAILLSALAYSKNAVGDIVRYLPGWSIVWNGLETTDGNYGFIALDPTANTYVLAIRGSLPPKDIFYSWAAFANWILDDFDVVTRVNWPYASTANALIASGTNRAFTEVQGMQDQLGSGLNIYDYLKAHAVKGGKQVIITGHSLGANIANVYASYFVTALAREGQSFYNNTSLITFAAPAAGNSDFSKDLDDKIMHAWHYENTNDIVPKFPVGTSVFDVGNLYNPGPSAAAITTVVDGVTLSLQLAFQGMAIVLAGYAYRQQKHGYVLFSAGLDKMYTENTIEDFLLQAAQQHHPENYAGYLHVVLPLELVEAAKLI